MKDQCEEIETEFYTLLAEKLIRNVIDEGYSTKSRVASAGNTGDQTLVTRDGHISNGINSHLSPV